MRTNVETREALEAEFETIQADRKVSGEEAVDDTREGEGRGGEQESALLLVVVAFCLQ